MRILGIDPGMRATGVCYYVDGECDAFTIRPKSLSLMGAIVEVVDALQDYLPDSLPLEVLVIERMQIYTREKSKGNPNDLIPLAMLAGAIMVRQPAGTVLLPTPAQWKGQVPKDIHHARIRAKVPGLGRCSKDAMDAVGLVLWALEREGGE